jgi:hypothetical protein
MLRAIKQEKVAECTVSYIIRTLDISFFNSENTQLVAYKIPLYNAVRVSPYCFPNTNSRELNHKDQIVKKE